ncbi:MAG TPA: hypothetical protein HPP65_06815 [Gammaproteobacteria bacterium]|jgi:hypothetical protein|nr:hypothetical protein [Gammaproteobacteria bacterium]MBT3844579.1 hypothetical protein [Gammaproteobacteria bacterium]MBT5372894.1 hypothetical protein [Gammaproteobacteria bacterium]MBT6478027.1 hypothetical protein [Gammaproteobacteria bacterium]MBT6880056.1 hypothetical protein [Gammaproteobacteria bacterium]
MDDAKSEYQKSYRKRYAEGHRRINISVTKAEYNALQHLANRENKRVTTLVKDYAFAGVSRTLAVPKELQEELKQLRFLIRNIANNVNQAAHYSNSLRRVADENGLLLEIKKLEDTVHEFVQERMKP